MTVEVLTAALAAYDAGLCPIKPKADGTKAPKGEPGRGKVNATGTRDYGWEDFQNERPARAVVEAWFGAHPGLGLVCGAVSGHLEMLELEGRAIKEGVGEELTRLVEEAGLGPLLARIAAGYSERTPSGGIHLLMRVVDGPAAPSLKLAQRASTPEELAASTTQPLQVLIESKGEGGFTIVAPSNGTTHPTGGSWTLAAGSFETIALVTMAERDALYAVCRQLDRVERTAEGVAKVPPAGRAPSPQPYAGGSVGESWMDAVAVHLAATDTMAGAIVRYGWRDLHETDRQGCPLFERPGQTERGRNGGLINANGRLVVFSTSTPFVSTLQKDAHSGRGPTYDLLDVYSAYEHEGDRLAAARAIAEATGIWDAWQAEQNPLRGLTMNATPPGSGAGGEPPPGVDAKTGEVHDARQLPERFWERPAHATIRDAALLIGVSPEAMAVTVIAVVAAHVPPVLVFPGKRRGVPNLLTAIVGPPGKGKGTVLDRALELVPPPGSAKKYKPGTAQGLVKAFHRATTKAERDADPGLAMFVRHPDPVILRVDEVAKFTATTGKDTNGQNLLAEIKSAVFGEALGQTVATDEKNLQCAERSYRLVGLLGVAPGIAGPLFDDVDGGLPQRVLFANLLRDDQEPAPALGPFDDLATDDVVADGGGQYVPLPPIRWTPPAVNGRQSFADSRRVAERVAVLLRARWDLLDAHVPYLTHAVAVVLAYFDGRWTVQPADLTLAGDVVAVSRATRTKLLAGLARSAATGNKKKAEARRDEAVATASAVRAEVLDLERLDYARRIVADVREWTTEYGKAPSVRDLYRNKNDVGAWRLAFEEATGRGWLREEPQETGVKGTTRRAVIVTDEAP